MKEYTVTEAQRNEIKARAQALEGLYKPSPMPVGEHPVRYPVVRHLDGEVYWVTAQGLKRYIQTMLGEGTYADP